MRTSTNRELREYEERMQHRCVNLKDRWQDELRKRELSPAQIDASIASEIEALKARGVVPAPTPEADPDEVRREEEERLAAQRKDTLRRMKSDVLVQRTEDGKLRFRHDLGIREGRTSS